MTGPDAAREIRLLNTTVADLTMVELLDRLDDGLVVTPNVDHLRLLQQDREFHDAYLRAEYRVCDSSILLRAARMLGTPLRGTIPGSDLLPAYCEHHRDDVGVTLFLVGGLPGVGEEAARRINERAERTMVVGTCSPPFGFEADPAECDRIIDAANGSGATTLVLGLGAPKQELFADRHRDRLDARVVLAVGAAIDFEAGNVQRAPAWMQRAGLEWLYRLSREPRRLAKRYLVDDPVVLWLLVRQRFGRYRDPFG